MEFGSLIKENIHKILNTKGFEENPNLMRMKEFPNMLLELMATCHLNTKIQGKLGGDPLDVKMFEATGWNFEDSNEVNLERGAVVCPFESEKRSYFKENEKVLILKKFEFIPQLQRMSVIVKDEMEENNRVYVKGSPEILKDLCLPETIPNDFQEVLSYYAKVI